MVEAVLDTGAFASVLTARAASALHGRPLQSAGSHAWVTPVAIAGLGGSTYARVIVVRGLRLAGARLDRAIFLDAPSLRFRDPRVLGLVGSDLLSSWDLDLDVNPGVLHLDLPQSSHPVPPWTGSTTSVALEARRDILIQVAVMLDGRKLHAVLDTGAANSIVTPANAAGQTALPTDKVVIMRGVAGRQMRAQRHRFNDFSIGGLSFGPADIAVGPLGVDGVDMIIGLDILRLTRFYVAYQAHTLLIDEGAH